MSLTDAQKALMYSRPIMSGDRLLWLLARETPELRILLPKQTKFKVIDPNAPPTIIRGSKMLKVLVMGGPFDDKEGFLPRTMVHDLGKCGLTLRVGEFSDSLTGISYGGYKTPFDDLDQTNFDSTVFAKACRFCGGKRSAHRIYETEMAKDAVSTLYDKLAEIDTGRGAPFTKAFKFKQSGQVMLGVLFVANPKRILAAYSGEADAQSDEYFIRTCKALGFEPAAHVKKGDKLPKRDGTPSDTPAISVCAAVKMIAHANRTSPNCDFIAMSEIWYDPKEKHQKEYPGGMVVAPYYGNKQTVESCNSCRSVVPAMLCGPRLQDTIG